MPDQPRAQNPAPLPGPEEELAKKQAELKESQDRITELDKSVTSLQSDIKALQAKIADVKQAMSGYDKSSVAMQQELDDDNGVIAQKGSMAEAVLKELKARIDQKIEYFDKALADQGQAAHDAWTAAQTAVTEYTAAEATAQADQAAYDTLKKVPKDAETALKDIAALLGLVAKAESQNDFVAMYFLTGEAKTVSKGIRIPSPADYEKALRGAQDTAENSKKAAAAKKITSDQAVAAATTARQAFDAATKSRRADLLKALKDIKPKAA
jgi:DNA repair exonuclease SbcCD ATPase subunit